MRLQSYDFFLEDLPKHSRNLSIVELRLSVSWVFVFKEIANTEAKIDKYRCFIILIH